MNFQELKQFGLFGAILAAAVTCLTADYAKEVMRERMF